MRKFIILSLSIFLLIFTASSAVTGPGGSANFDFPEASVDYADSYPLIIEETSSFSCPAGEDCKEAELSLKDCPAAHVDFRRITGDAYTDRYQDEGGPPSSDASKVFFPQELGCTPGKYTIHLRINDKSTTYAGGYVDIQPEGKTPNYGKYLYVNMDVNNNKLYEMSLTDTEWSYSPKPSDLRHKTGSVMIMEKDPGVIGNSAEKGVYEAKNTTLSLTGKLSDVINCSNSELNSGSNDRCMNNNPTPDGTDGNCANDPCAVASLNFQTNNWFKSSSVDRPGDINPIIEFNDYKPSGELIIGRKEISDFGKGKHGFFICREGMNGVTVDTNHDKRHKGLYRCYIDGSGWQNDHPAIQGSPKSNQWIEVDSCGDGVDNNGADGADKFDSDDCGGNYQEDETGPAAKCDEPVVGEDSSGNKYTYYKPYDPSTSTDEYSPHKPADFQSCKYEKRDSDMDYIARTKKPITFECDKETAVSAPAGSKYDEFCKERYQNRPWSSDLNPMPAVRYFVNINNIPLGNGRWATSSGFKANVENTTLHQAEIDFSSSSTSHQASTWKDKDISEPGPYETSSLPAENSWKPVNSGNINDTVVDSKPGTLGQEGVFKGGFAAKCPTNDKWIYSSGEWQCGSATTGEQTITISVYKIDSSLPESYAGFQINQSEIEKWKKAHNTNPFNRDTSKSSKVQVRASCWWGGGSGDPELPDSGDMLNLSARTLDYTDGDVSAKEAGNIYAVGNISDRPSVPDNQYRYTCAFGLRQLVWDRGNAGLASDTKLYKNRVETSDPDGYITEGTNRHGKIGTQVEVIEPPTDMDDTQAWLEEKANQHTTNSNGNGPMWENYYRGQDLVVKSQEASRQPIDALLYQSR